MYLIPPLSPGPKGPSKVEKLKQLRCEFDGIRQIVQSLKPSLAYHEKFTVNTVIGSKLPTRYKQSEEINKSISSLLMAKAWLGKVLEFIGEKSPYKTNYKNANEIDLPSDTVEEIWKGWSVGDNAQEIRKLNHIEKVCWLRNKIEEQTQKIIELKNHKHFSNKEVKIAINSVFIHSSESKMWLGFELQRLKENISPEDDF
jgi:hypothetical protein